MMYELVAIECDARNPLPTWHGACVHFLLRTTPCNEAEGGSNATDRTGHLVNSGRKLTASRHRDKY